MQYGTVPLNALQATFVEAILPVAERHARVMFRGSRDRDDAVQEVVALCWAWFLRLAGRGKDATAFPTALATFATRAVRSGRRLCGQHKAKDALSSRAQRRGGFTVATLPDTSSLSGNALDEALHDNTQTPPDEQAAFRIDFPAWLTTRDERDRQLIGGVAVGERTLDLARAFALTPGRVSQLRAAYHHSWLLFHGEAATA